MIKEVDKYEIGSMNYSGFARMTLDEFMGSGYDMAEVTEWPKRLTAAGFAVYLRQQNQGRCVVMKRGDRIYLVRAS